MARPEVPTSEKYRRVTEAYQIELEYGHTIEAYEGEIDIDHAGIVCGKGRHNDDNKYDYDRKSDAFQHAHAPRDRGCRIL